MWTGRVRFLLARFPVLHAVSRDKLNILYSIIIVCNLG